MTAKITLHELTGSPNSVKVRIALDVKALEYDRVPFELDAYPGDRSAIVAVSTQSRLPVLVHGDIKLFDSGAILRYLDANFPDTPRLYSEDHTEHGEIEQWELWGRTDLSQPVGMLFGQAMSGQPDPAECAKASALLDEVTGKLEDVLQSRDFLVRDTISAADVALAPGVGLAMLPPAFVAGSPIARVFHDHFHLGDGRERTRAWAERVLAHDPLRRS